MASPDEIVIVGGGFAGLAAGVALAGAGRRVRLFEQRPHLGGRARSFRDPATGSVVDNGQHIFMGCYRAARQFLKEIGTLNRIAFQEQLTLRFIDPPGRMSSLICPALPAPWHLLAGIVRSGSFSTGEKVEVLRLGRAIESHASPVNGIKQLSVDAWLQRMGQSEKLRQKFWDLLCIAAMNEQPQRASASLFEHVLRLALFDSAAGSRIGVPRWGLSECYTEAARAFITARGGEVEVRRGVANFVIADGACRGVRLADGTEVEAGAVVNAAPWHELGRLLPGEHLRADAFFVSVLSLRPAPIISIYLWFDRPVAEFDFAGLRGTTVQWVFDRRQIPEAGENGVSLVLSGAQEYIGQSKEELLDMALRDLRAVLPASREARLQHSLILKERFATFSPTCDAEEVRPCARTPIRGLYFAGDWTATGLPSTIEGAVQSGYKASQEALRGE